MCSSFNIPELNFVAHQAVEEILEIYRMVLAGNYDEDALMAKVRHAQDGTDYIKDKNIRQFLSSNALWNVTSPSMRKFIEPYHLEWLPEYVEKLMRGGA